MFSNFFSFSLILLKVSFPPYGQKGRLQSAASKLKTFLDSLEGRLESRANFKRKAGKLVHQILTLLSGPKFVVLVDSFASISCS